MKVLTLHYINNIYVCNEYNQRREPYININLTYMQHQDLHSMLVDEVSLTPNTLFENYVNCFADDIKHSDCQNEGNNIPQTFESHNVIMFGDVLQIQSMCTLSTLVLSSASTHHFHCS